MQSSDYRAGILASLTAEAVFVGMVAMVALARGKDPWMVTRVPGAFLLGSDAVQPPGFIAGDVALGLLMHLLLGIMVGVIYAALLPLLEIAPMAGGLITGAILYAMGFWVLPLLFPAWLAPFWLPPMGRLLQAIAHAVYGWVFGATYSRLHIRTEARLSRAARRLQSGEGGREPGIP
jgi:hypothetical protein